MSQEMFTVTRETETGATNFMGTMTLRTALETVQGLVIDAEAKNLYQASRNLNAFRNERTEKPRPKTQVKRVAQPGEKADGRE